MVANRYLFEMNYESKGRLIKKIVWQWSQESIRPIPAHFHWATDLEETMLRHLLRLSLAQRTVTICVDYLVLVISLPLLIGILTSCVPKEDAAAPVGSTSDGSILRVGDV